MRRISGLLLSACALGVAVPGLVDAFEDRAAEVAIRAAIGRDGGASAGRIRARDGARTIEIDDAAVSGAGWRVAIGRLVLPGPGSPAPALVASALARPAPASADDVDIVFGRLHVMVPHLEARGTDLTSADLAGLLDRASPTPIADRLAKLTGAVFAAPTVVVGPPGPEGDGEARLTLSAVSLTDVDAGRIGELAIGRVAVSQPAQAAGGPAPLEAGPIAIDGIDLPLALAMATGSRNETAMPVRPLFRSLSVAAIALRPDADTRIAVGPILAGALRGRPLLLPPSDVAALLDKPADERTTADRQVLADLAGDAAGSAALDHLEVRDVSIASTGDRGGSFKLARAALDGFEIARLGSLSLDGAAVSTPDVDISLDRFVLGGYDASGAIDFLKRQFVGTPARSPAPLGPNRFSMAMTGLHLGVPASPRGMAASNPAKRIVVDVPVAGIGAGIEPGTGAIVSRASVEMAYDVTAGAADPSYRDLIRYGMARLDLGADYHATLDPAAREMRLDRLALSAQGLGHVSVGAVLGNVSPDLFRAGPDRDAARDAAQKIVFRAFDLLFVNDGVVERVLPVLAASAGVSVPLLKAQLKAQAEIGIGQALGQTPAAARIVAALGAFIDTPRNLSVSIRSPAGLPLATVQSAGDPQSLLGTLDIEVVADR